MGDDGDIDFQSVWVNIIQLRSVTASYPGRPPLFNRFDFQLNAETRVGLLGSNGSGKSTLLRIMLGLHPISAGQIVLFGEDCRTEEQFRPYRTRIGLVFQNPRDQLFCPTVREELSFGPRNLGVSAQAVDERVDWALERFELTGISRRVPYQLSGGEQHLVALAAVLTMNPEVLLLDEPFDWLDGHRRDLVVDYLLKEAPGYLLVAQDQSMLEDLCPDGVVNIGH